MKKKNSPPVARDGVEPSPAGPSATAQPLSLASVFDQAYLTKVVNNICRAANEQLIRDPLDHAAYLANRKVNVGGLIYRVKGHLYQPAAITRVRAAKRDGITRPLAFLELEDQLVLKAVTDRLEPRLLAGFPRWVDYGRASHRTGAPDARSDYESAFTRWIRHQQLVQRFVAEEHGFAFLVEADISNFFPSVNLALLRHAISATGAADEELLNLLFFLLHFMVERPNYAIDHELGLPQENYDASRVLAHFFLASVDSELHREGEEGRYVRWVDDMCLAARSEVEGRLLLGKVQRALERRGLTLNAAKSRIRSAVQARSDLFLEENAYLEEVHNAGEAARGRVEEFELRLRIFLDPQQTPRVGGWERVLRRFYTQSRRIGSGWLESCVSDHLRAYPGSAQHIVKYLLGRPHTPATLGSLQAFLCSEDNLYEDVEIRVYELLLRWRCDDEADSRSSVWRPALDHFFGRGGYRKPLHEYVRGLIALLVFRLAGADALDEVAQYFKESNERHFLRYGCLILVATDSYRQLAERKALASEDIALRRLSGFLEELRADPSSHIGLLRRYLGPTTHQLPDFHDFEPRGLPLVRITRIPAFRRKWNAIIDKAIEKLEGAPSNLRDHPALRFLKNEREQL